MEGAEPLCCSQLQLGGRGDSWQQGESSSEAMGDPQYEGRGKVPPALCSQVAANQGDSLRAPLCDVGSTAVG